MTAVALEQYRPAMDSCMVGMRLCRLDALTAPDSSDPGKYPEEYGRLAQGYFNRNAWTESIASTKVSMKELLYNFGVANLCYENGDGNLAVSYASERYDV